MKRVLQVSGKLVVSIVTAIVILLAARGHGVGAELLMVEQQGCHWCQRWHAEVGVAYPKTAEGQRAPLLRIDIADVPTSRFAFASKVTMSPTFVLVDDGREVGRITGYPGADFFWGLLAELLQRLPPERPTPELFKTRALTLPKLASRHATALE